MRKKDEGNRRRGRKEGTRRAEGREKDGREGC